MHESHILALRVAYARAVRDLHYSDARSIFATMTSQRITARPCPRLARAMHRAAIPAATVAEIFAQHRARADSSPITRDIIRAAFQNRHLTRDWIPYPDRCARGRGGRERVTGD